MKNCVPSYKAQETLNGGKFTSSLHPFVAFVTSDPARYEMRRECQEILPGLLLGPFQASKSLELLQGLQITHMSACITSHSSRRP
jgi:hypothetical protein